MDLVDVVIVALLVFALVAGWNSGLFPQVLGLAGAVLGGGAFVAALSLLQDPLSSIDPTIRAVAVLIGLLVAVGLGEAVGSGVGTVIRHRLGSGVLGDLDRVTGSLIGLAQGILVVWLVGGALAAGPVPNVAAQAQRSAIVRSISAILPPPTAFVGQLGRWLDASGLPDLFVGLEPFPALPVDRPTDAQSARIARLATASTVAVHAAACQRISTGTGFVVGRPGYVVTNAHVVAGSASVAVAFDSSSSLDATVVLFDPRLDVALLRVPALKAPPLLFATAEPARGTPGAALGHPGGSALRVIPAAVTASYLADGRDIYGTGLVTRRILELRAAIDRGDSGGPLVLADGSVGGVVYAEALSDPTVGYALSPIEVATRIQPALGRTAIVGTGACIR